MTHHDANDTHGCGCTACRSGGACPSEALDPPLQAAIDAWRRTLPPDVPDAYVDSFLARVQPALRAGAGDSAAAAIATHVREELQTARADAIGPRFHGWLSTQGRAGRRFDFAQRQWLEWIARDIAINGSFVVEDFDYAPYVAHGGVGRALRMFGHEGLSAVLQSMNTALGWKPSRTRDPVAELSPLARDVFKVLRYEWLSADELTPADRDVLVDLARAFLEQTEAKRPARTDAARQDLESFARAFVEDLGFLPAAQRDGVARLLYALVAGVAPDAARAQAPASSDPAPQSTQLGISTREALHGRSVERYGPFFHILVHERSQIARLSPTEARALGDIAVEMVDRIRKAARDERLWTDPDLQRELRDDLHDYLADYDLVDPDELPDVVARIWSLATATRGRITQEET